MNVFNFLYDFTVTATTGSLQFSLVTFYESFIKMHRGFQYFIHNYFFFLSSSQRAMLLFNTQHPHSCKKPQELKLSWKRSLTFINPIFPSASYQFIHMQPIPPPCWCTSITVSPSSSSSAFPINLNLSTIFNWSNLYINTPPPPFTTSHLFYSSCQIQI